MSRIHDNKWRSQSQHSNLISFQFLWLQGGCHYIGGMGGHDSCFPSILSSFIVFQVYATCILFDMHYNSYANRFENNEASKTRQENETENAPTVVNVNCT